MLSSSKKTIEFEDDQKERVILLINHRLPWLVIGLIGGIISTLFSAQFEDLLSKNIQLAFFIPIIVYMADAVGTQTETVYIRNLAREKISLHKYFIKEFLLGISLGSIFGIIMGIVTFLFFHSIDTAFTIGTAMFATIAIAPLIALLIPTILNKKNTDPAVVAGPFTTIVQDLVSLLIYFTIASLMVLTN